MIGRAIQYWAAAARAFTTRVIRVSTPPADEEAAQPLLPAGTGRAMWPGWQGGSAAPAQQSRAFGITVRAAASGAVSSCVLGMGWGGAGQDQVWKAR